MGSSTLPGDVYSHPFLWTKPGRMRDLGTLGGPTGTANAINEAGEVVGYADLPAGAATSTDAFLWRKGKMTDLGALAGHCFSGAFAINAKTQVTGASFPCDGSPSHAILWENGGPMVDLNDLVSGADMTLTGSGPINDRGEITGGGVLENGELHAFLLIRAKRIIPPSRTATTARLRKVPARLGLVLRRLHKSQMRGPGPAPGCAYLVGAQCLGIAT